MVGTSLFRGSPLKRKTIFHTHTYTPRYSNPHTPYVSPSLGNKGGRENGNVGLFWFGPSTRVNSVDTWSTWMPLLLGETGLLTPDWIHETPPLPHLTIPLSWTQRNPQKNKTNKKTLRKRMEHRGLCLSWLPFRPRSSKGPSPGPSPSTLWFCHSSFESSLAWPHYVDYFNTYLRTRVGVRHCIPRLGLSCFRNSWFDIPSGGGFTDQLGTHRVSVFTGFIVVVPKLLIVV